MCNIKKKLGLIRLNLFLQVKFVHDKKCWRLEIVDFLRSIEIRVQQKDKILIII